MPFDNTTPAVTCLTTTAGQLLAALKIVGRALDTKIAIPVLGCVLFESGPGRNGSITATDMDLHITAPLMGVTDAFLVDHKELVKFCTGVDGHEILTITKEKGDWSYKNSVTEVDVYFDIVTLQCDGMSVELQSPAVCDFPVPTGFDREHSPALTIMSDEFSLMLKTCLPCISTEETRYYLNGIYVNSPDVAEGQPRKFSMVSTDGHRMAEVHTSYDYTGGNAIVPIKTAKILGMLVDAKHPSPVSIYIPTSGASSLNMLFVGEGWRMVSKQIDGTFPDYTRVRAQSQHGEFTAPIKETVKALKRIIGMMDSGAVLMDPNEQTIVHKKITAKVAFGLGGNAQQFGVNPKYMQDVLGIAALYGDDVRGYCSRGSDPVAFKPLDNPAWGTVQITQMPMRY